MGLKPRAWDWSPSTSGGCMASPPARRLAMEVPQARVGRGTPSSVDVYT